MCETNKTLFLRSLNARKVFLKIVIDIISENSYFVKKCIKGHNFIDILLPPISRTLFNIFCSNYVKELNNKIHANKTGSANTNKLAKLKSRKLK